MGMILPFTHSVSVSSAYDVPGFSRICPVAPSLDPNVSHCQRLLLWRFFPADAADRITRCVRPNVARESNQKRWKRNAPIEFWWRRGRVELPVQKKVARMYYRLSRPPISSPVPRPPTESGQASHLIFPGFRQQPPRGTTAFRRSLLTRRGGARVNAQPI